MGSLEHAARAEFMVEFSTDGLRPRDQFDAWRTQLGFRFGLAEVSREATGGFRGAIETLAVSQLALSDVSGDAMRFDRTARHVAQRSRDGFTVGLLVDGSAVLEQSSRSTRLAAGDLVLCDDRLPLRIRFERTYRMIVFQCDRWQVETRLPDAERRTAQRIPGQAALPSATATYVSAIARQATGLGPIDALVAQHALEVLTYTLGDPGQRDATARVPLLRIQAYIEDHLADPALDPEAIARHHRISRRHLYRLFEEAGDSVADFIRRQRLARCRAMLGNDAHARRTISEIAFACGFNDATTFGRAFRAAFGMTPRDYRRRARTTAG